MITNLINAIKYWSVERIELKKQVSSLQSAYNSQVSAIAALEDQIRNKKVSYTIFELERHRAVETMLESMSSKLRKIDAYKQREKEMQSEIDQLKRDMIQMGQELALHRLAVMQEGK